MGHLLLKRKRSAPPGFRRVLIESGCPQRRSALVESLAIPGKSQVVTLKFSKAVFR